MLDRTCRNCTLAITYPQQVILANFPYADSPDRAAELALKPQNGDCPEMFHAWCLPLGWVIQPDGPMSIDVALALLAG